MSIRAHTRSKGHCVAAALAYRIGCEVTDSRTGIRHDFSRRAQRGDVVASGFSYGAQAPAWNRNDVQAFADALEGAERRKNSIVCRDVEIALPHELAPEKREALAARWAQHLASRYNAAVAYAVHRPDRRSDERNHHVHCLMSTRALGKDGTPGAKLRQFHVRAKKPNKEGKPYEPERTDSGGSDEIHTLRAEWEVMCNEALAEAGIDAAIAMGRLEDPRDRAPNLTRGEVEAERNGWRKRHPKTRQLPMRVAQLVVDDGVCVTKRGRELARCVATRAFMEHVTRRPVTRPRALPAAEPEPERALAATQAMQPVRTPAPELERPARRRRRRRARIRAVEASATPEPTRVQASGRAQEPRSPVQPVEAPLTTTEPTPISPPARTQAVHSAVCAAESTALPTPRPIPFPEQRIGIHSAIATVEPPPAPQRPPERRPKARSAVVLAEALQLPIPKPPRSPQRRPKARSAVVLAEALQLPIPKPPRSPQRRPKARSAVVLAEALQLPIPKPPRSPQRRPKARSAVVLAEALQLPIPKPPRSPQRRPKARSAVVLAEALQLPIPKPPRSPQRRSSAWSIVRAAETVRIPDPTTITHRIAEIARALRDLVAQRARFLSTSKSAARQEDEMISISEIATHGVAPGQDELSEAHEWLARRKKSGQGTSIPAVADSVARQRLTGNPVLSEFHPERYSERPSLPTAISELAPRAAPGFHGDRFGPIPDTWNTGACRTRDGAEQAANVLERAIDDIARQHFDGRTDPRDYEPGWFKPSVEKAKEAAMQAWQALRETTIDRMVTAAGGPEAIEIRRRLQQENTDKQARERTAQKRREQLATVTSRPIKPDDGKNRWD